MSPIRRILIAVKNPDTRRQPGIDKAIRIARRLGATVELFHAISTPVFLQQPPIAAVAQASCGHLVLVLGCAHVAKEY